MNVKRSCANIPPSKEPAIDIYLLLFLIIILVGSVIVTIYYLKEKSEEFNTVKRGFCPRCRKDTIELIDQRLGGCSGPMVLTYECSECGYHNSFSINEHGGGCSSG